MLGFTLKRGKEAQSLKRRLNELFGRVAHDSSDNELLDVAEQGRLLVNDYIDVEGEVNIESFVTFLLGEWPNPKVTSTVKTFVLEIICSDIVEGEVITDSNNRDSSSPAEEDELIDKIISIYECRLSRQELAQECQSLRREFAVEEPERLKEELRRLLPADATAFINFVATSFIENTEVRTRELRHWSMQLPETSTAPKAPAAERNKVKMLITKTVDKIMKKLRGIKNISTRESIASFLDEVVDTVRGDIPVKGIFTTAVAADQIFEKIVETLVNGNPDFERVDVMFLLVRICGSRFFEIERVREEKLTRGVDELGRILEENTAYRTLHDAIWRVSSNTPTTQMEAYWTVDSMLNNIKALRASKPDPIEVEDLIDNCRRIKNSSYQRLFKGMLTQWMKLTRNFVIQWGINANVLLADEPRGYVRPKCPYYRFGDAESGDESNLSKPSGVSSVEPTPVPTPKAQAPPGLNVNLNSAKAKPVASPAATVQFPRTPASEVGSEPKSEYAQQPKTQPQVAAGSPIRDVNMCVAYIKSWDSWCGRPLSFFEIHNLKRFMLRSRSGETDLAHALTSVTSYDGSVTDVLTLVAPGQRTVKHNEARVEAEKRLKTHVNSPFCSKIPATLPLRPSGLRMERGSLVELYHVLLTTFALHFHGAQVIDAQVAENVIEYFGLCVLHEMWSLRFAFIAAATAWRKSGSTATDAEMRQVSQTFISFVGRHKHAIDCGSVDLYFTGVGSEMDLPTIFLDSFEVSSDQLIFLSDVCALLRRCGESIEELEGVARILASDHGLMIKDEDSFQALLEVIVLNCDSTGVLFDQHRQAILNGLVNQ